MYNFGDIIEIKYSENEIYKAVIFKDKIGYEDGKQDLLNDILSQESSGICKITKLNNNTYNLLPTFENGTYQNEYGDNYLLINGELIQTTHGM